MTSKKSSTTYELMITVNSSATAATELIKEVLITQGVSLNEIVEVDERPFVHLSVFFHSRQKALSLKNKLRKMRLKGLKACIRKLKKKDWFTKRKAEFKPLMLTRRIRIIPSWMKAKRKKENVEDLFLDTGFAFGSGMHPTTKFMAELIERCRDRFDTFLDIGTGSGVLSLVAFANNARTVEAVDISSDAIRTAKANFSRNGFTMVSVKKQDCRKLSGRRKYDFVAANLITQDLITFKKKIVSLVKRGKYLAVSGISVNNLTHFKKAFRSLSLRCLKVHKAEGWCAILYKKL